MSTFNAGAIEAKLALDRTSWEVDLRKTQEEIDRLENTTITVGIDADDTNARIVMDNLELFLEDLASKTYTPKIDLDTAEFDAAAAEVETVIAGIDANDINVKVDVDAGLALAELAELEAAIIAVDHNDIDIKVNYDRDTLGALVGDGAGGIAGATGGGQLGLLELAMILIIGLAPIIGVAIGAATAAIIAFVAALVAAAGPLIILGLGLAYLVQTFIKAKKHGDALTTPMQNFADALDHLKTVFDNLKFPNIGFALLTTLVNLLADILPSLVPIFKAAAGTIDDVALAIKNWVNSPGYKEFIRFFTGFGIDMLRAFIIIGGNLLQFFGGLFGAIEPFARGMMKALEGITRSWADWSANLSHNEGFQTFLANAHHYGPMVLTMLGAFLGALIAIGRSLQPFAGPALIGLTNFFNFIAHMDPKTLGILVASFSALFLVMKIVVPLIGTVVSLVEGLSAGIGAVAEAIGISVGALLIWAAIIAGVVALVIYLYNTNKTFHDSVISTWNDIKKAIRPIVEDITKLIRDNWGSISEWASGVWGDIEAIVVDAMVIIHQIIFFITTAITFIWKHFGDQLLQIIKGVAENIGAVIKGFFQILRGIFDLIRDVLTGKWSNLGRDLKEIARGFLTAISGTAKGFKTILLALFTILGRILVGLWNWAWTNIKKAAGQTLDWIKEQFHNFIGWLAALPGKISHSVVGLFDSIGNEFKSVINDMIRWWNNLSFSVDIPNKIPGLPDSFTISTPNLNYLAEGAWVDKPTMAIIGEGNEPEIVSPESKMRKIFSESNHFDYTKLASAIAIALRPLFGSLLTPELVERLLRQAAPNVNVDASDDNKSAHALAGEMAFQLRVLGYGGAT